MAAVREPSAERVGGRHADCAGCDWAFFEPVAAGRAKRELFRETMQRLGHLDPAPFGELPLEPSPPGYRLRARLHVADTRRRLLRARDASGRAGDGLRGDRARRPGGCFPRSRRPCAGRAWSQRDRAARERRRVEPRVPPDALARPRGDAEDAWRSACRSLRGSAFSMRAARRSTRGATRRSTCRWEAGCSAFRWTPSFRGIATSSARSTPRLRPRRAGRPPAWPSTRSAASGSSPARFSMRAIASSPWRRTRPRHRTPRPRSRAGRTAAAASSYGAPSRSSCGGTTAASPASSPIRRGRASAGTSRASSRGARSRCWSTSRAIPATLARDLPAILSEGFTIRAATLFDLFAFTHRVEALVSLERAA